MASIILTPVTLWKDFDDSLQLNEDVISSQEENGFIHSEVYFYGRKTSAGRVKIFAHWIYPKDIAEYPAVMVLFEAGLSADMAFVEQLTQNGYAVLCVDYCGEQTGGRYTEYPSDIDYANFVRAGRHKDYAEPTARETSWYEWAAVARYGIKYLSEKKEVTKAGAIGIRTGGEVLWKIAPFVDLACMISVCAAGWLAYRGMDKFGNGEKKIFDEERHRFIAGIDSQSYAPYVKCPVMLLSAINDEKYNYDRVYDTFRQINPQVEKSILYSSHGNGLIGHHSIHNMNLFLNKHLKGRSVFIGKPVGLSIDEDEAGNLVVRSEYDNGGEIAEYGLFYTEKAGDYRVRDWTRILGKKEHLQENVATIPLSVYGGSGKVLVYSFVRYSNEFSATSKISEIVIKKQYANVGRKSRVIYSNVDELNGFSAYRRRTRSIADCFTIRNDSDVRLVKGYGGIEGITCEAGIISYRVSEPRYDAHDGANFLFDAYCAEEGTVTVIFTLEDEEYTTAAKVEGKGKWNKILFEPSDFKSAKGGHLESFKGVTSLVMLFDKEILINNVIWL